MKIIKCNEELLNKIPSIFNHVFTVFGDKEVDLYGCIDDGNNISFIALDGINGLFMNSRGYKAFKMDLNYNVKSYMNGNYVAYFSDTGTISFVDKDDMEYSVFMQPLDEKDDEEYDGEVVFTQYNPKKDILCQLSYSHMYREMNGKPRVYSYHTNHPRNVYIEEENSKNHDRRFGKINKHIKNYSRYSFERGMVGYTLVLINEHGILRTLLSDSYTLERDDRVRRFTKSSLVFNDQFLDGWPFAVFYKVEDIEKIVKDYGFRIDVPEEIIAVYNDLDLDLSQIREVLKQLNEQEVRKDKGMKLQLVIESK